MLFESVPVFFPLLPFVFWRAKTFFLQPAYRKFRKRAAAPLFQTSGGTLKFRCTFRTCAFSAIRSASPSSTPTFPPARTPSLCGLLYLAYRSSNHLQSFYLQELGSGHFHPNHLAGRRSHLRLRTNIFIPDNRPLRICVSSSLLTCVNQHTNTHAHSTSLPLSFCLTHTHTTEIHAARCVAQGRALLLNEPPVLRFSWWAQRKLALMRRARDAASPTHPTSHTHGASFLSCLHIFSSTIIWLKRGAVEVLPVFIFLSEVELETAILLLCFHPLSLENSFYLWMCFPNLGFWGQLWFSFFSALVRQIEWSVFFSYLLIIPADVIASGKQVLWTKLYFSQLKENRTLTITMHICVVILICALPVWVCAWGCVQLFQVPC